MKYRELKAKIQKEVNDFPMGFAFDEKQLQKELERLNTTRDDVVSIGAGGFIRKTDKEAYNNLFININKQMEDAMLNDSFLKDAIIYELGNHEYCITYDPTATIEALSLNMDDERVQRIFKEAIEQYWINDKLQEMETYTQ